MEAVETRQRRKDDGVMPTFSVLFYPLTLPPSLGCWATLYVPYHENLKPERK